MSGYALTHLRQLEAESIHIIREVAAEFENPVMLYSIGKDSAVTWCGSRSRPSIPAKLPFPLLHIDTTWKFREMIAFRDRFARREQPRPDRAHQPGGRVAAGINPFDHGSKKYTDVMKTQALLEALTSTASTRRSAARAATRRSRAPRSASTRSATASSSGIRRTSAPSCGTSTTASSTRARASASSRCRTGPSSTCGSTSTSRDLPIVPLYFAELAPGRRARRQR